MVQDLRAVNEATEDIHPGVHNPYTLVSALLSTRSCYSVLDLKDDFFCIPLALESQEIFLLSGRTQTHNKNNNPRDWIKVVD